VRPSIVDPHGHHLEDSLVKLQGLALFAKTYGGEFQRIEAISKIGPSMRMLDLQEPTVRGEVLRSSKPPEELYAEKFASTYAV
jgi:type III restriction enzyme